MTGILRRTAKLFPVYRSLKKDISTQRSFIGQTLRKDLWKYRNTHDGTLDEEDFNKITEYYGFGVPAIVVEGFCTLRGVPMTGRERMASTYLGALTGLYDDFFDKTRLSDEQILSMMQDPEKYAAKTSLEELFIHFLVTVKENIPDRNLFDQSFKEVFLAQKDSLMQEDKGLTTEIIHDITIRKGGRSLLLYRSVLENKMCEGEPEAIYEVGGLMQLGNDLFDIHKDHSRKIKTLPTVASGIEPVRTIFLQQMDKAFGMVKDLPYRKKDINSYLHKLSLGISRCLVCLDQLEKLQIKNKGIFDPGIFSREELICDMEKPSNLLRSAFHFIRYEF